MGYDYALVHLKCNLPVSIVLTILYRPLFSRVDAYKITFLISVAFVSTLPWDSYLVRQKIWTYPPNVIIGPRLCSVPAEECFFFVIQTYNTGLLYLLLSKPVFKSTLPAGRRSINDPVPLRFARDVGIIFLLAVIAAGFFLLHTSGKGLYMGLILSFVGPITLVLWSLAYQFLVQLPLSGTILPILVSTIFLWIVDTNELRKGTWNIESGTKLDIQLWEGLEIEEAIFFLATNVLIVFGLVAFDNALAILYTFPNLFIKVPELPSLVMLVQALITDTSKYDCDRIRGIQQASRRLQKKSRSFHLASAAFPEGLRIDLTLLYSFCRMADDLVDNATCASDAHEWISKLSHYLDLVYASKETRIICRQPDPQHYIIENFPPSCHSALQLLSAQLLSHEPLYGLLDGFKTDLKFQKNRNFPIEDEYDLDRYAQQVAGTVAELFLELVYHHSNGRDTITTKQREQIVHSGGRMGVALQYVNISRDIVTDAKIGRVYIPTSWLKEENVIPQDVLDHPDGPIIEKFRDRLLRMAFNEYRQAQNAILQLPSDARAPIRVAVESYMEIGRVLRENGYVVKEGKATVPRLRRLRVAWIALNEG